MENLTVFHHNNVLSNKLDIRNNVRRENNYSIFRKCTNQITKDGQILHFGKTQEITTEIDGQVWECTVPTSRAEQYSETLNISNLRNIENNCTVLRVISEQSPMENAIKVEPTLEDLYLFYFKGVNE